MNYNQEILDQAAKEGARKATEAFSLLSGEKAEITVSKVVTMSFCEAAEEIEAETNDAVVVYEKLLNGKGGMSLLIMPRDNALILVDLLQKQPVGTTGLLKDIDRSAIKETLNILSNSYLNALVAVSGDKISLGVPRMIHHDEFSQIVCDINREKKGIIFKIGLSISRYKITASLCIVLDLSLMVKE